VHENNIYDDMIAKHTGETLKALDKRYSPITPQPRHKVVMCGERGKPFDWQRTKAA
jgi:hypothetical protein